MVSSNKQINRLTRCTLQPPVIPTLGRMNLDQPKLILSKIEISLGILCNALSIYSFSARFRCPAHAADCGGFEMMGAWFGFGAGVSLIASGLLLRGSGYKSWLGHLLLAYFGFLVAFVQ